MTKKTRKDGDIFGANKFTTGADGTGEISPEVKSAFDAVTVTVPSPEDVAAPSEETPVPSEDAQPDVLMTFDRWFATTGRPPHHKGGMLAYIGRVKGKRLASTWAQMFANY